MCPRKQGQSWSHTSRVTKDKNSTKNFSLPVQKWSREGKKERRKKRKAIAKLFALYRNANNFLKF